MLQVFRFFISFFLLDFPLVCWKKNLHFIGLDQIEEIMIMLQSDKLPFIKTIGKRYLSKLLKIILMAIT